MDNGPVRQRRHDPGRADRIADAALEVIADVGVERLTHRAVARAADVPLGSTTYHFVSREDLLLAALERAVDKNRVALDEWVEGLGPDPDLPTELTGLILKADADRRTSIVGYEIYVAALRHPNLRGASTAWTRLLPELLERFVDAASAEALAVAVEALVLRVLIGDRPPERDFIEAVLRRISQP